MLPAFGRKISLQQPEIAASCLPDGMIDRTLAAIVSRKHKQPVSIFGIEIFKLPVLCFGAFVKLRTLVPVTVDFEPEEASRFRHQLPGANGADPGYRV